MKIIKSIEISEELEDIEKFIIQNNVEQLNFFDNKYKNKYFSGCKILKILKILRKSEIIYSQCNYDTVAIINVELQIEGYVCYESEIILVKILNVDANGNKNCTGAEKKYLRTIIQSNNRIASFKTDQYMIIMTGRHTRSDSNDNILLLGKPWIPNKVFPKWSLPNEIININCYEYNINILNDYYKKFEAKIIKFNNSINFSADLYKDEKLFDIREIIELIKNKNHNFKTIRWIPQLTMGKKHFALGAENSNLATLIPNNLGGIISSMQDAISISTIATELPESVWEDQKNFWLLHTIT